MRIGTGLAIPGRARGPSGFTEADASAIIAELGGFWLRMRDPYLTMGTPPAIASVACKDGFATYGSFAQASTLKRPTLSTVDGGKPSAAFDGSGGATSGKWFVNNKTAATWKWLHAAEGCTLFVVARRTGGTGTQRILDTGSAGSVSQHGISLSYNATTNSTEARVTNGGGIGNGVFSATVAGVVASTLYLHELTHSLAAGYSYRLSGGTPTVGEAAQAYSTSNPFSSLGLGANAAGSVQWLTGDICEVYGVPGVLTAARLASLRGMFAAEYP